MKAFVLSPEADQDLTAIKSYLLREAGVRTTQRVMRRLRERMVSLGRNPEMGHLREDLTGQPVKFWSVFSYIIVYDPSTKPIEIVRVLHGNRDVKTILN